MTEPVKFRGHEDMPERPMTLGSTLINKTGSWKYVRPVYRNKTAPCSSHCPAGNDIQGVMDLLAAGDLDGAWARLVWENPFPAVTGRVCHHPCESACNRAAHDAPLSIHHIERFLGDYGRGKAIPKLSLPKGKRVAVAGSGPAGLSAAYHLARLGFEVTVFEAQPEAGGVLRYGIPENRLPKSVLRQEVEKVEDLGVTLRTRARVGVDVPFEELEAFDAVFLATGVGQSRALDIPGEDLDGVWAGLDFLSRVNRGQRPPLGRHVAVIGGGNTAIDVARTARRLGARATIFYRRTREEMPAIADEIEEAVAEGVELAFLQAPVAVHGEGGRVRELELQQMALGEPDDSGRRRPVPRPGAVERVPVDAVMTAIGERADFSFLPAALAASGSVLRVDEAGLTPQAPLFAGGDIVDQPHTVVDAIASGKRAAMAIDMHLAGEDLCEALARIRVGAHGSLSMRRYVAGDLGVDNALEVAPDQVNVDYFPHRDPVPAAHRDAAAALGDFDELGRGYTEAEARAEAERCFNCGVCNQCDNCLVFCPDFAIRREADGQGYVVDYEYCKGCGICAYECPRHVIEMVREGAAAEAPAAGANGGPGTAKERP